MNVDAPTEACELLLSGGPQEVSVARRFAVTCVARLGADEQAQDRVRTLVSELVTNVVLHARTPGVLTVQDDGDHLRVLVTDGSPALPRQARLGVHSTHGRGWRLVQILSVDSGSRPSDRISPTGKTVWFTVCKQTPREEFRRSPRPNVRTTPPR